MTVLLTGAATTHMTYELADAVEHYVMLDELSNAKGCRSSPVGPLINISSRADQLTPNRSSTFHCGIELLRGRLVYLFRAEDFYSDHASQQQSCPN